MTDSTFYVAPDAENEPTVWRMTDGLDIAVVRRCDLSEQYRADAWDVLTGHLRVIA